MQKIIWKAIFFNEERKQEIQFFLKNRTYYDWNFLFSHREHFSIPPPRVCLLCPDGFFDMTVLAGALDMDKIRDAPEIRRARFKFKPFFFQLFVDVPVTGWWISNQRINGDPRNGGRKGAGSLKQTPVPLAQDIIRVPAQPIIVIQKCAPVHVFGFIHLVFPIVGSAHSALPATSAGSSPSRGGGGTVPGFGLRLFSSPNSDALWRYCPNAKLVFCKNIHKKE